MNPAGRQSSAAYPAPSVLLPLPEISHDCICTWIASDYRKDGTSKQSLKFRNTSCPAVVFHRRLGEGTTA